LGPLSLGLGLEQMGLDNKSGQLSDWLYDIGHKMTRGCWCCRMVLIWVELCTSWVLPSP